MDESPIRMVTAARLGSPSSTGVPTAQIRTWARNQGYSIGDRGRLPVEVIEAYRQSMNPERAFPVSEHG
ncbi:histone-like nucleoid-structuring protein Lsr2 [Streptosporangium amethystogenes subsp. fukuiense]